MSATKFYSPAPLETVTIGEEGLQKKTNDLKSFNNFFINLTEKNTYFKAENRISKKKYRS